MKDDDDNTIVDRLRALNLPIFHLHHLSIIYTSILKQFGIHIWYRSNHGSNCRYQQSNHIVHDQSNHVRRSCHSLWKHKWLMIIMMMIVIMIMMVVLMIAWWYYWWLHNDHDDSQEYGHDDDHDYSWWWLTFQNIRSRRAF